MEWRPEYETPLLQCIHNLSAASSTNSVAAVRQSHLGVMHQTFELLREPYNVHNTMSCLFPMLENTATTSAAENPALFRRTVAHLPPPLPHGKKYAAPGLPG